MDISVTLDNGRLYVRTPFSAEFPQAAKKIKGKWSPDATAWHFDPRDEREVREILKTIFGWDEYASKERVSVRLTIKSQLVRGKKELAFAGVPIAYRSGRDAPVVIGESVRIVEGEFAHSAGSARYPELMNSDDEPVTVLVRDFPITAVENAIINGIGGRRMAGLGLLVIGALLM